MWPDDCYRLDELRRRARVAFSSGNHTIGTRLVGRLMSACQALDVNPGVVTSAADVQAAVQRAKDRINKKWVP